MLIRAILFVLCVSFTVNAEQPAPNWVIQKADNVIGSKFLLGKPYVIHFWATWCPYCKRVQPGIDSLAQEYENNGVKTFAISFWENENANPEREMLNRGLSLNVFKNGDDVAKAFGVQGTPTTVFVDHQGNIVSRLTTSDPNSPQLKQAYQTLFQSKSND